MATGMLHQAHRLERNGRPKADDPGRACEPHRAPPPHRRFKDHHHRQSAQLLSGMLALLGLCGTVLYGPGGLAGLMQRRPNGPASSPPTHPETLLDRMGARRVGPHEQPALYGLFSALCWRAGLNPTPALFCLPTPTMNAFAVGGYGSEAGEGAVVVTEGLLANLTVDELAGILAHEVAHIRNRDTSTLALAHDLATATELLSLAGLGRLRSERPGSALPDGAPDPGLILCLAPAISRLLQLALQRIREHDADLDAVALSGGAIGLIRALQKLERHHAAAEPPGASPPCPTPAATLLRSHPETPARVGMLAALGPTRKFAAVPSM